MIKIRKNKKGFTLVELIVVITVLAILAAIAIPIAGNWVGKAKTSSDASNIALFQSAIEKAVADGNAYPKSGETAVVRSYITSYSAISTPIAAPQNGDHFIYNTATNKVATGSAIDTTHLQIDG